MNKKLIFCLLLIFTLCSCSFKPESAKYSTQENISFNYNNIDKAADIWLTNENLCFLKDNLIQNYYLVNENGKKKICSNNGYGFGEIQDYGDKIYMLDLKEDIDEENAYYLLKCYDVKQKTINDIFTIANCSDFFVINDDVFYLQFHWHGDTMEYSLKMYSLTSKTHTTINNQLFSFGVIENEVYYLTEANGTISIFKYDKLANSSVNCGSFELNQSVEYFKESAEISYTPNYIMCSLGWLRDQSIVWNFSLKDKSLNQFNFDGEIMSFISYDECSYFISDNEGNTEAIYKFVNNTGETTKIAEFPGYCGLFVGSDSGAYVVEYDTNKIFYCSEKETPKFIGNF